MSANVFFRHINVVLAVALITVLSCSIALAQETSGRIQGQITDGTGQPLPGATVTAVHLASATIYITQTLPDGRYILPNLRIGGPYTVTITYVGMLTQMRTGLTIVLGDPLILNVALTTAGIPLSEVVVRATRRGAQVNAYGAGTNIKQPQISLTPTVTRAITDVTRLVPQGSKDNSFLGTNFRYNNVTIDGAINNDAIGFSPSLGGITGTSGTPGSSTRANAISLDAVEDMQVYLAPYDVSLGNFTGASINAVTRSGTNTLTGSVYAYGRNALLTGKESAGDGSAMPKDFHDYLIGFRLGFPVVKNKLFFFTDVEVARRQDPILLGAGTAESSQILSLQDAKQIRDSTISRYGFDPGTYGKYDEFANSNKYFTRLDWNLDRSNQLSLRNNTIISSAVNLERDQADFRFGSIAYEQLNTQYSTVAELKTKFTDRLSNSAIVSYINIHDWRDPFSNPAFPQVQIVGRSPGSTIFFGTDREASIFNQRQSTVEITDNVTYNYGQHTLSMGTHNEFYHINYGFVNSWNGRVDYASVDDFLANNPSRVRGSFDYGNNTRPYILTHPVAVFPIDFFSVYMQDENRLNERVRLTYGLRIDDTYAPRKPVLSSKTQNAQTDPDLGTSYTYTPLNTIVENFFNRPQLSPRLGFNVDVRGDKSLIIRGGAGLFTGRIPFAWLGYAYYNNGQSFGAYDQSTTGSSPAPFNPATDPLRYSPTQGIAAFAAQNGQAVGNPNAGKTQVDVVDNRFIMPKVLRSSVAVDFTDVRQIKYTLEGIFTKTLKDVKFQQINLLDQPTYYAYDTARNQLRQPIFASGSADPHFTNAYEMSNTRAGYRWSATAQISKTFPEGLFVSAAYTYGVSKDVANGIRNSMESNWQLNQSLNPNNPGTANSNFDIRSRIIAEVEYLLKWDKANASNFTVFFNAQSGSPFTYGFVNYTIQNTPQQVSLVYIPKLGETINFFQTYTAHDGTVVTAQQQADAFDQYINSNKYLSGRRGDFTERNAGRTPWNVDADFHFSQDFDLRVGPHTSRTITFSIDILNLTNLLYKKWGWVYYSPNTYNSTESVGLSPYEPAQASGGYPIYQFTNPGKPYAVDLLNSRWQMQFGVRYSF